MKIETNFTAPIRTFAARTALATWVLALGLGGGAIALALDAAVKEADVEESRERLAHLEARRAALGETPDLPGAVEIAALGERIATVNALSVTGGRRVAPLLALFEELLPEGAWLASLHYKGREGEIVLVAESERAEQLTEFLLRLERSLRFSEVLLSRQSAVGAERQRVIQFELRLKERA